MFEVGNWNPEKKPLRKLLIQNQKHCYNYLETPERFMPSIFKNINQQRKRIRTLEKKILSTSPLLIYSIRNKHPLFTRHFLPTRKRTGTIKEVFSIGIEKDQDKTKISLKQMLTLLLKRMKKISSILNLFTTKKKAILPISALGRRTKSLKTSTSLNNFCAGDCS